MVGTLIKQPNGKYCIVDYAGDVRKYNLTDIDIINMYIEDAKACIGAAKHYGNIIKETKNISDDVLKEMGFNQTYDDLLKFIPRKPTHQEYAHCDFTTYGDCPNCGKTVMDGIGGKDEKCRYCGQILKW